MTYTVDVKGDLKIIKSPPVELTEDWEDFMIKLISDSEVHIELHGRTPWYPDVVAKMFVLGHFYEGKLEGHGEDHSSVTLELPPNKQDIIHASERTRWDPAIFLYQVRYTKDRFLAELTDIGFASFYPEWLSEIPKSFGS